MLDATNHNANPTNPDPNPNLVEMFNALNCNWYCYSSADKQTRLTLILSLNKLVKILFASWRYSIVQYMSWRPGPKHKLAG